MRKSFLKIIKISFKTVIVFIATILLLLLLIKFAVQIPAVQNILKNKIVSALTEKLNRNVEIDNIYLKLPATFAVDNIFIGDKTDTAFYLEHFYIDIKFRPLFNRRIEISKTELVNSYGDLSKLFAKVSSSAGTANNETDTTSQPWDIAINKLSINNCYYKYRDNNPDSGFEFILDIGKMDIELGNIFPDSVISIKNIKSINSSFGYKPLATNETVLKEDTAAFQMANIHIENGDFSGLKINYADSVGGMLLFIDGKTVKANDILVDVSHRSVFFDKGVTSGDVAMKFIPPKVDEPLMLWQVSFNNATAGDLSFNLDFEEYPETPGKFNFFHLGLSEISGDVSDFFMNKKSLELNTENLKLKEKCGLEVTKLETGISQTDSLFSINKLNIKTKNGDYSLKLNTTARPLFFDTGNKWFDLKIDANATNLADINKFYALAGIDYLSKRAIKSRIKLNTAINGTAKLLNIENFKFQLLDSILFIANGKVTELLDSSKTGMQINLHKLMISENNLKYITTGLLSDTSFKFPDYFVLKGELAKKPESFSFSGKTFSSIGNTTINITEADSGKNQSYNLLVSADIYNLKSVTTTGLNSINFNIEGAFNGNKVSTGSGRIMIKVDTINFNDRNFKDIELEATALSGFWEAYLNSRDSSVFLNIDAEGEINNDNIKSSIDIAAKRIDLDLIGIRSDVKSVSGTGNIIVDFNNLRNFNVTTNFSDVSFYEGKKIHNIPDSKFIIINSAKKSSFKLISKYNNLAFTIDRNLQDIPVVLSNLPGYYLNDSIKKNNLFNLPTFSLNGELNYKDVFTKMITKNYPSFDKMILKGYRIPGTGNGFVSVKISGLNVAGSHINSTIIDLRINRKRLIFNSSLSTIKNKYIVGKFDMNGIFKNGQLISNVRFTDNSTKKYFNIHSLLEKTDNNTTLSIHSDSLVFNYFKWDINPDNEIYISDKGVNFSNFDLSSDNQRITVTSADSNKITKVSIQNFNFGTINDLLNSDTLATGLLSSNIIIRTENGKISANGDLGIDNLVVYDFDLGKLKVPHFSYNSTGTAFDMLINSNNLNFTGTAKLFSEEKNNKIDIDLKINKLNLNELNYLLSDYVYDFSGNLKSELKISGTTDSPVFNGKLAVENSKVGIKKLNNYLKLGNELITIKNNVLNFNGFEIIDERNLAAKIRGTVAVDSEYRIIPNLKINTQNMVLMNSKRNDNSLIFGILKAQADLELTSRNNRLQLESDLTIDGKTDIGYIIPEDLALKNSSGTVRFTEFRNDSVENILLHDSAVFKHNNMFEKIHSAIKINSGAKIKLFFENEGEDYLDASFQGAIDYLSSTNETEVSGRINIENGELHYSIPLVKTKDYKVEPDSYIKLSSDINNPYLHLIASSDVRASTEGLISDYNKAINFKVLLIMEGNLNDLKLRFDISPVTNDAIVSARLSQLTEKERNVNALNLLIRRSFILTSSGSEVGSTDIMDAQIDKFYSNQLNHLISDNIHFIDVRFDVESYFDLNSTGYYSFNRNVYYNLGKSFFNDRAKVNYKGSLGVSANLYDNTLNSSQFIENELEVEIKITEDGRYRGVFFRKDKYEGLLEGEIIETGAGLRIKRRYNSVKDIFKSKKRIERENED